MAFKRRNDRVEKESKHNIPIVEILQITGDRASTGQPLNYVNRSITGSLELRVSGSILKDYKEKKCSFIGEITDRELSYFDEAIMLDMYVLGKLITKSNIGIKPNKLKDMSIEQLATVLNVKENEAENFLKHHDYDEDIIYNLDSLGNNVTDLNSMRSVKKSVSDTEEAIVSMVNILSNVSGVANRGVIDSINEATTKMKVGDSSASAYMRYSELIGKEITEDMAKEIYNLVKIIPDSMMEEFPILMGLFHSKIKIR